MNRVIQKPKIVVFASGGALPNEWGSGFRTLKLQELAGELQAEIVAVISQYPAWWVANKAKDLKVPFIHIEKPFTADKYKEIVRITGAKIIALSGWVRLIKWLDPSKSINIHPWPLGKYGGKWMYGDAVHAAIYEDLKNWDINRTCVTMHFATPIYDDPQGLIFQLPIELRNDPEIMNLINDKDACIAAIKKKVNAAEHERQRKITNMVANKEISADRDEESQRITNITFPNDYVYNQTVQLDTQEPYGEF